ncbi:MAG: T9SS type A sorting domain-containing protein [Candidatus Eisenbacteria bacterium]|uniref:T9SS type A sorting domain-containing protein n=1 Tax=Eiseniibacteriota bacterium TaxID=2212470 RepID=A0A849SCB7_UNCEI|nr:T9SS type A sorting domain-containing protein [Candidatus Eisenbacteria bacterium]
MHSLLLAVTLLTAVPLPGVHEIQSRPAPILMVHYMPWFEAGPTAGPWGWHWTMNHFNPNLVDAQGRRQIASHYYPLIGPYDSRDPDLVEYHVLLMKVAGLQGAIVDWNGSSSLYDYPLGNSATRRLFDALAVAQLSFAICYEDQSITQLILNGRISSAQAIGQAQADMVYVRDRWANKPAYLTLDEAPVVLNFGPQYFQTPAEWKAIFSVFSDTPQFFPLNFRLSTLAAGAFSWPPMWASVEGVLAPERLDEYLDEFHANGETWPGHVGGAFPGFHDIYEQAGVQPSYGYLDARDGLTFSETLNRALIARSPIIQIVTWNDFGEGTNIEPTLEYGYRYLEHVQEVAREFRELPYSAQDLRLPRALHALRKQNRGNAAVMAQLNQAAAFILSGQPAEARAILASLQVTAIEPESIPTPDQAVQIRPNPMVNSATVLLDLPASGEIRLDVFDVTGRWIACLASGHHAVGRHGFDWDARRQSSGIYLVRLQAGRSVVTRKVLLQR